MCDHRHETLELAESVLDMAGGLALRREPTQLEWEFGDVERISKDFDKAEAIIVKAAAPVVKKMVTQLMKEAEPLIKAGDSAGIAKLQASYLPELTTVLKDAVEKIEKMGEKQVRDQAKRQGVNLADSKRKSNLRDVLAYLWGRAELKAELIKSTVQSMVQGVASRMVVQGVEKVSQASITAAILSGTKTLIASAVELGREAYGMGRLYAFDEVKDLVEFVVYSAILDNNTCDVCLPLDGEQYPASEAGKAPNDGCLGGDRCRCFEIYIFRR